MKKTTVIQDVLMGGIRYFIDMQFFFKKEFIKERYYLHFTLSLALTFLAMSLLVLVTNLSSAQLIFKLFFGAFSALCGNLLREGYLEKYRKTEFSLTDCFFGSYGGALAGLLVSLIF